MPHIFISYRRADSASMSRRLYDALTDKINKKYVFRDVDTLMKGKDFRAGIERFIFQSDVMLVLIGDEWLNIRDTETGELRLHNPEDFVRIEVDMGLRHVDTVIPVLVNGASMPTEDELPRRLSQLAFKNAIQLRDDHFDEDFQALLEVIGIRQPFKLWLIALVAVIAFIVVGVILINQNIGGDDDLLPTATSDVMAQVATDEPTLTLAPTTTDKLHSTDTPPPAATDTPQPTVTHTPQPTENSIPKPSQIALTPIISDEWELIVPILTSAPIVENSQIEIVQVTGLGDLMREELTIRNGGVTIDLSGWKIVDLKGNIYTFLEVLLFNGGEITISTRSGESRVTQLFWGLDRAIFEHDNIIILLDSNNNIHSKFKVP